MFSFCLFFLPIVHEIPLGKSKRLLSNFWVELNATLAIHQNKLLRKWDLNISYWKTSRCVQQPRLVTAQVDLCSFHPGCWQLRSLGHVSRPIKSRGWMSPRNQGSLGGLLWNSHWSQIKLTHFVCTRKGTACVFAEHRMHSCSLEETWCFCAICH